MSLLKHLKVFFLLLWDELGLGSLAASQIFTASVGGVHGSDERPMLAPRPGNVLFAQVLTKVSKSLALLNLFFL